MPSPEPQTTADPHPDFVVSQFHGDNIAMSWFIIVKQVSPTQTYKLIIWGTGAEVPSLLFELVSDPMEDNNLIATPAGATEHKDLVDSLITQLKTVVDFPTVAMNVAQYGRDSFAGWVNSTKDWKDEIHKKGLRWTPSWNTDSAGAMEALEKWMHTNVTALTPCHLALKRTAGD